MQAVCVTEDDSASYHLSSSLQSTVQIGNQLPGLKMKSIIVGGVSGDQVSVQQGFYGCMQV